MVISKILSALPSVASPGRRLGFKEKLKWTGIVLIVFYILGEVDLFGLQKIQGANIFGELQVILASSFGTLVTLGIGPIVLASIIIQLLSGAGVLKFDMTTPEGKSSYMGAQKILAILFTIFEAVILVISGQLPADPGIVGAIGIGGANLLIILQILVGGIIIIYLDEIVSKWGFGSGISLFIAAGVSVEIAWRALSPLVLVEGGKAVWFGSGPIIGAIPDFIARFQFLRTGASGVSQNDMFAMLATAVVFVVTMYAQSIKVEVPISYGRVRGLSRRYPLPFVYASNMPVIFISALIANMRFWVAIMQNSGFKFLGTIDATGAHGPIKYMLPYHTFAKDFIVGIPVNYLHAATYLTILVAGSIIFSMLWVSVSGMDSAALADKLSQSGMQIPGFRSDPRVIEKVLDRYVPYLTIMGGAFVGALAAGADFTGALGGGTGVLLTVGIVYHLYEEIASEQLLEMHPAVRSFIGEGGI